MATGLTRSKNLSESNLNLKTALQKLYAPGIEDDIEIFSLSSSVESLCFSGLVDDENTQIFRLTTERLKSLSGNVIKRTKFLTKYFTFTDENKVYFTQYNAGVGSDEEADSPRFSVNGSVPTLNVISGGGGFYFLDSNNNIFNFDFFEGTWSASSSSIVTITLSNHGFKEGQGLFLRFDNSSGGVNATGGDYVILDVPSLDSFIIENIGGSISGSGKVGIENFEIELENVSLLGKDSESSDAKANIVFERLSYNYLPGINATYSNTNYGIEYGSTHTATITLTSHGLSTGDSVYIRSISGSMRSGFVSSITKITDNTFTVVLPLLSVNTDEVCEVCLLDELFRFTQSYPSRFSIKSVQITDAGSNYLIPEELEIVESNANNSNGGSIVKIRRQFGRFFDGMPEIIRTNFFTYTVKNSNEEGFFLYDEELDKYLFLDRNTAETGLTSSQNIVIKRFDGINVNNILQFKFAQSPIYLRSYTNNVFSLGDSISSAINGLSASASNIKSNSRLAIQNTKRPTLADSDENIFGYTYNSFSGQDVVIWQRVVLRDQDYIIDPLDTTLGSNSITGERFKTSVDKFVMGPRSTWSSDSSGKVSISLANHSVNTGDSVTVSNVIASSGVAFSEGTYTATYENASSFSISTSSTSSGTGSLDIFLSDPKFQIRVPGLFIKVGGEYKRAFSTTDKPFFQSIIGSNGIRIPANPPISGTDQGALSAEGVINDNNPTSSDWHSYDATISELAQRINSNGKDGAFYFHRQTAPTISTISVGKNGVNSSIYAIPLFTLV